MFRACRTFEFESGHQLSKHHGKCQFPHGHTRKVEIVLEAETLDSNEMVVDFHVIKEVIAEYVEMLDHSMCVNKNDLASVKFYKDNFKSRTILFEGDPTTELMAKEFFDVFKERLKYYNGNYRVRDSIRLVSVKLWETSTSWAEYCE